MEKDPTVSPQDHAARAMIVQEIVRQILAFEGQREPNPAVRHQHGDGGISIAWSVFQTIWMEHSQCCEGHWMKGKSILMHLMPELVGMLVAASPEGFVEWYQRKKFGTTSTEEMETGAPH